ncbi:MAG: KH domain-containing protein [Syntrophales bacterium LBB04]|nr:KH domain-containing protein [Syntrophales bacterium LBB04]
MGEPKLNHHQVSDERYSQEDSHLKLVPPDPVRLGEFQKLTKQLLETGYKLIVEHPEDFKVTIFQGPRTTVFNLHSNKLDLGQVLGRKGRVVDSFRVLLKGICSRYQFRAVINVEE